MTIPQKQKHGAPLPQQVSWGTNAPLCRIARNVPRMGHCGAPHRARGCPMEKFGTLLRGTILNTTYGTDKQMWSYLRWSSVIIDSEKAVAVLGDGWWPQAANQEHLFVALSGIKIRFVTLSCKNQEAPPDPITPTEIVDTPTRGHKRPAPGGTSYCINENRQPGNTNRPPPEN